MMNLSIFTAELFGKLKAWLDPKFTAIDARLAALEEKLKESGNDRTE